MSKRAFVTIGTIVLSTVGMLIPRIAAAQDITLTPTPTDSQSGPAGSTVGWGYTITNDTSDYYQPEALDISPMADDTPTIIFDFPTVAPDSSVTEDFDPSTDIGLVEVELGGAANSVDTAILTMIGELFADSSLTTDLGAAPEVTASITATTTGPTGVPEGNPLPSMALAILVLGYCFYLRSRSTKISSRVLPRCGRSAA